MARYPQYAADYKGPGVTVSDANGVVLAPAIALKFPNATLTADPVTGEVEVDTGASGVPGLADVLGADNDAGALAITNLADPSADQDAATKKYVDDHAGGGGFGVVVQQTDQTNATTTYADTDLTVPVVAGTRYRIRIGLFYNIDAGGNCGFQAQLTTPARTFYREQLLKTQTGTSSYGPAGNIATSPETYTDGNPGNGRMDFEVYITPSADGAVTFQFNIQFGSGADTIYKGATLEWLAVS